MWEKIRVSYYAAFVAVQPLIVHYYGEAADNETQLWIKAIDGFFASIFGVVAIYNVNRTGKGKHEADVNDPEE